MVTVSKEWEWLGPVVTLPVLIILLRWEQRRDPDFTWQGALTLAGLMCVAGVTVDTCMIHMSFFKFAANPWRNIVSPPWMMSLWMAQGVCLYVSGRDYFDHYWQFSLCASLAAAVFYAALGEFGALFHYDRWQDTVTIAVIWAVVLPAVLYGYRQIQAAR